MRRLGISIGCLMICIVNSVANADEPAAKRFINTGGQATIYVAPDEVELRFEVHTFDKDIAKAKAMNDESAAKVVNFIKSLGIEDKHIQTERIRCDAEFARVMVDGNWQRGELRGYSVGRSYLVKSNDLSKFDQLSDRLLTDPTISVGPLKYRTTKLREMRDQARSDALLAARQKAEAMAAQLGCKVGAPHSISEVDDDWYTQSNFDNSIRQSPSERDEDSATKLGQIPVRSRVQVSFDLIPPAQ